MSMTPLELDLSQRLDIGFRPQVMEPMFRAAESGQDLSPAIATNRFDARFRIVHVWSVHNDPSTSRLADLFLCNPAPRMVVLYEQKNYVEIDPRIAVAQDQCGPVPWDRDIAMQITPPKQHAKLVQFLEDASAYGIRSGVAWGVRNPGNHGVIVALNCRADDIWAGTAGPPRAKHR